ncbi:glycosyltransferase [Thiocystis violascens]|uniref:Putative glycosyltransferase n=1 Tax=Thiocystis violascens (strain ATCC 17096 / DSM 198 / 6111) TaxID=765911 RepID=I3YC85_THIV6|nr:glycosyltransferase [Thiocystis violascens]AFL74603.1 putative glycosyltransferase [Thiocystis violascens DSM 198]
MLHVLRTEGAGVLLRKLARRVRATPLAVKDPPVVLTCQTPLQPLSLPVTESPLASIVIPAHACFAHTHHCLAALARAGARAAFEVIVVTARPDDEAAERLARYPGLRLIMNPNPPAPGIANARNRGAELARGATVVFLNPDTQVQSGWLDALLQTFQDVPDAGMVGSRLLYPDGRQREAGGILFDDGTAGSYGDRDDPDKPEYSYRRAVDYCSGAALAIRAGLFRQLGGFDVSLAPDGREDLDLAIRVRAAGFQVYYQPTSTVVQGDDAATARHDRSGSGFKIARRFLAGTWRQRRQPEPLAPGSPDTDIARIKERQIRRRAFVADNYMLTPDRESGSLRMSNLFVVLQELGFKITFAAANLEAPEPYVSQLQARGVECLYRPYVRSLAHHLETQGHLYDLVIASRADTAAAVLPIARRHCPNARLLFDTVDLHYLREARLAELAGHRSTRTLADWRKRQELGLIDAADATLVVSPVELELLRTERPRARLYCVSNVHRIHGSATPCRERQDLLFIGAFAHPPNADAVRWLIRDILPLARARLPGLHCHLIGADPPAAIRALAAQAGAGVTLHGYVPDVKPWFDQCRLSVAPLRYGAGVKGKINQSLAHGLPVVATGMAAEGMFLVDGESVLLAETPADFAAAIVRLYTDEALWERLSTGGLSVMERHFSFAAARRAIAEAIDAQI